MWYNEKPKSIGLKSCGAYGCAHAAVQDVVKCKTVTGGQELFARGPSALDVAIYGLFTGEPASERPVDGPPAKKSATNLEAHYLAQCKPKVSI